VRWLVVGGAVALFARTDRIRAARRGFRPTLDEGAFTMMVYRTNGISVMPRWTQTKTDRAIVASAGGGTRVLAYRQCRDCDRSDAAERADFYIFYKPRGEWRKVDGQPITRRSWARSRDEIRP
jgi:Cu/Ag efflux pump CusA